MNVEVYVVNREHNKTCRDELTLQFGNSEPPYDEDQDLKSAIAALSPVFTFEDDDGSIPCWGLDHRKFPTLSMIIKLKNDHPMYKGRNSYWYAAELTLDEIVALMKEDLK